jgi:hypothetical protein
VKFYIPSAAEKAGKWEGLHIAGGKMTAQGTTGAGLDIGEAFLHCAPYGASELPFNDGRQPVSLAIFVRFASNTALWPGVG